MSKYGVIFGPYFPLFSPNTGKYGPEITLYLDTFHVVRVSKTTLAELILREGDIEIALWHIFRVSTFAFYSWIEMMHLNVIVQSYPFDFMF